MSVSVVIVAVAVVVVVVVNFLAFTFETLTCAVIMYIINKLCSTTPVTVMDLFDFG